MTAPAIPERRPTGAGFFRRRGVVTMADVGPLSRGPTAGWISLRKQVLCPRWSRFGAGPAANRPRRLSFCARTWYLPRAFRGAAALFLDVFQPLAVEASTPVCRRRALEMAGRQPMDGTTWRKRGRLQKQRSAMLALRSNLLRKARRSTPWKKTSRRSPKLFQRIRICARRPTHR